jgi:hypothetical protein
MAGASGYKREYDQTFLTPRVLYRTVSGSDDDGAPGVNDVDIPEIRLDIDGDSRTANCSRSGQSASFQRSGRAYNGQLFLYVHLKDDCKQATINVWVRDDYEDDPATVSEYLLVDSSTISNYSGLAAFRNIPAGKYKVTATGIDTGSVVLVEQHTA